MNERTKLLRKLSAAQFAVWEIHLFLDTHPKDKTALEAFKKYSERYNELLKEYKKKYGSITADIKSADGEWKWISNPWPWDPMKEAEN